MVMIRILSLKAGCEDTEEAIKKLYNAPKLLNAPTLIDVVIDEDGNIIGHLTPFISDTLLLQASSSTSAQKAEWKSQLSTAINNLHENDIVWGDANPNNIMLTNTTVNYS